MQSEKPMGSQKKLIIFLRYQCCSSGGIASFLTSSPKCLSWDTCLMQRQSCLPFQVHPHGTGYRWEEGREVLNSMSQVKGVHLLLNFWAAEHIRIRGTGKEANFKSVRSFLLNCIAKPCHPSHGELQLWYLWWTELVGTWVQQFLFFPYNDNCLLALCCDTRACWADGALPSAPTDHCTTKDTQKSKIVTYLLGQTLTNDTPTGLYSYLA